MPAAKASEPTFSTTPTRIDLSPKNPSISTYSPPKDSRQVHSHPLRSIVPRLNKIASWVCSSQKNIFKLEVSAAFELKYQRKQ